MCRKFLLVLVLTLSSVALGQSATFAQTTVTWTGGAGNLLWSSTNNWSSGTLPQVNNTVVFNGGAGNAQVTAGGTVSLAGVSTFNTGTTALNLKNGAGFTLSNFSQYTYLGSINIQDAYAYRLDNSTGGMALISQLNVDVTTSGTFTLNGGVTVGGFGTGFLVKTGAGEMLMTGGRPSNGSQVHMVVRGGVLSLASVNDMGTGYLAVQTGGVFRYTGTSSESRAQLLYFNNGSAGVEISQAAGNLVYSITAGSDLSSGGGTFTKSGAGTFTMATNGGDLSLGKSVALNGGSLALQANGTNSFNFGTSSITGAAGTVIKILAGSGTVRNGSVSYASNLSDFDVATGAVFDANGVAMRMNSLTGGGTVRNTNATAATLTVGVNNGSGEFSGLFSGTNLGLTKTGTGSLSLSGVGSTLSQAFTLSGGGIINTGSLSTGSSANAGNVAVNSGTYTNQGQHSFVGSLTVASGASVVNSGTMTMGANSFFQINGAGSGQNTGTMNVNFFRLNGVTSGSLTTFTNAANGSMRIDSFIIGDTGYSSFTNNGGRLTIPATGGQFTIGKSGGTETGTSTLTVNSGTVTNSNNTTFRLGNYSNGSNTTAEINLNGGLFETVGSLAMVASSGTNNAVRINFNGGTLRGLTNNATLLASSVGVTLAAGGGTIDLAAGIAGTAAAAMSGVGGLTKTGAGTLLLTGSNGFTGAAAVNGGTLDFNSINALRNSSGVSIAGGAGLRYSGGAASFDRNITVTSGTGTVTNSGGGLLTLAGTLTKDGTVLRLTGGQFNVTGQIVGSSSNSDLVVDGTSTVTLSSANTYNGPTFVNQASNLIVNINNAIPSGSIITLGDATTSGTLSLGSFSNAIGGLSFGAGGGTLRMAAASTSSVPLTASAGTVNLNNGTLDLTGSGTSAGLYRLISAQTVAGTLSSVTGANAAYQVVTTSSSVNYQQRAVLGAVSVTNPAAAIITGGSAAFTYTVANNALAGGADLAFSSGSPSNIAGTSSGNAAAGGSSSSVSGLVFTGTSVGAGRNGTFAVNAPSAFGSTTASGTVSVDVYDHASGSLSGGTIRVADSIVGYSGALTGLTSATVSNAAGYRVNLKTLGTTSAGGVTINNVSGVAQNSSATISASVLTGASTGANAVNQQFTLTYADDSNLNGTSNNLGSTTVTVQGNVYDHASGSATGATIALADSIVGYTGSLVGLTSATISNAAGYRVNLMTTGGTSAGFVNINNVGGVAAGSSGQISAAAGLDGSQTVGANSLGQTFNLTYADDSNLNGASNNLGGQAITVTGRVLDHATSSLGASLLTSTTVSLGTYNYSTNTWETGGATGFFDIYNLASAFGASLTADLSLVNVTGAADGFTTNLLASYADIAGGSSQQFSIFFDPTGVLANRSTTFTISMSDKTGMAGATASNTLYVTASVIVVPEPGAIVLAGLGIGLAGWMTIRRRHRAA